MQAYHVLFLLISLMSLSNPSQNALAKQIGQYVWQYVQLAHTCILVCEMLCIMIGGNNKETNRDAYPMYP